MSSIKEILASICAASSDAAIASFEVSPSAGPKNSL